MIRDTNFLLPLLTSRVYVKKTFSLKYALKYFQRSKPETLYIFGDMEMLHLWNMNYIVLMQNMQVEDQAAKKRM